MAHGFHLFMAAAWLALPSTDCYSLGGGPSLFWGREDQNYGVVLDIGSTGSRIRVYKWSLYDVVYEVPEITEIFVKKSKKPLPDFLDDITGLSTELNSLLCTSLPSIPARDRADTPVFAMATSGLRFLGDYNASKLLDGVTKVLLNSSMNPYYFRRQHVRILSGEEEGLFAWLAVNHLQGNFNLQHVRGNNFTGVVEMGGGSVQVAFQPEGQILAHKFSFLIGGNLHSIYVHSHLGYGQYKMAEALDEYLIQGGNGSGIIEHPCRLKGDRFLTDSVHAQGVTFRGSGNPEQCQGILNYLFFNPTCRKGCLPKPCPIASVYQPYFRGGHTFYALSAFKYTLKKLQVVRDDGTFTPEDLRQKTFQHCQQVVSSDSVGSRHSYCTYGVYMALFLERLGFTPASKTQLRSDLKKINGQDVSWPLGALLYELSQTVQSHRPNGQAASLSAATATSGGTSSPEILAVFSVLVVTIYLKTQNFV